MNQHMIIGNLVHDPETGATEGGVNWCRFKVAVRKKYKPKDGQPDADFIRVTAVTVVSLAPVGRNLYRAAFGQDGHRAMPHSCPDHFPI